MSKMLESTAAKLSKGTGIEKVLPGKQELIISSQKTKRNKGPDCSLYPNMMGEIKGEMEHCLMPPTSSSHLLYNTVNSLTFLVHLERTGGKVCSQEAAKYRNSRKTGVLIIDKTTDSWSFIPTLYSLSGMQWSLLYVQQVIRSWMYSKL